MQDPSEPDRPEILSGPGDVRLAQRSDGRGAEPSKNNKKIIAIAASALVAVLAAGGIGYMLAANPTPATQQGTGGPAPSQSAGPNLQDDDATMGDVATDAPKDGLPDDGSMGDADTDTGTGGDPTGSDTGSDTSTGSDPSRGTTQTGTGQRPSTSSPTKPPQAPEADTPADGPAGEVSGQCSASGC
ncbi:hypothetical protein ACTWPT_14850 [Nonomuraea sp. 3N208]|uniref:hypothetical protein n=1 Tax=Nonomuraea sp. 3N208 TaxID=3457421 RepID=UPI003FCEB88C